MRTKVEFDDYFPFLMSCMAFSLLALKLPIAYVLLRASGMMDSFKQQLVSAIILMAQGLDYYHRMPADKFTHTKA